MSADPLWSCFMLLCGSFAVFSHTHDCLFFTVGFERFSLGTELVVQLCFFHSVSALTAITIP